jgi:hypothetical protein
MEKRIKLPSKDIKTFYRLYLELMKPILRIKDTEADVLAGLLYYNYQKKHITDAKDRYKLIFATDTKVNIRNSITNRNKVAMTRAVFEQTIGSLRKKGIIIGYSGEERLLESIIVNPEDSFTLSFNIDISNGTH